MAKQFTNSFIAKKRIRRPGKHKKNVNKANKPKNFFG